MPIPVTRQIESDEFRELRKLRGVTEAFIAETADCAKSSVPRSLEPSHGVKMRVGVFDILYLDAFDKDKMKLIGVDLDKLQEGVREQYGSFDGAALLELIESEYKVGHFDEVIVLSEILIENAETPDEGALGYCHQIRALSHRGDSQKMLELAEEALRRYDGRIDEYLRLRLSNNRSYAYFQLDRFEIAYLLAREELSKVKGRKLSPSYGRSVVYLDYMCGHANFGMALQTRDDELRLARLKTAERHYGSALRRRSSLLNTHGDEFDAVGLAPHVIEIEAALSYIRLALGKGDPQTTLVRACENLDPETTADEIGESRGIAALIMARAAMDFLPSTEVDHFVSKLQPRARDYGFALRNWWLLGKCYSLDYELHRGRQSCWLSDRDANDRAAARNIALRYPAFRRLGCLIINHAR